MKEVTTCDECNLRYLPGVPEEDLEHQRYHDEAVNGPRIALGDGCFVIRVDAPPALKHAAERAAILAKRDAGYDFPAYIADDDDLSTTAVIAARNARIVGLIVTRDQECSHTVALTQYAESADQIPLNTVPPHRRTAVEMIWVLKAHRGSAIAREVVAKLTKELNTNCDQLAHMTPFTDAALKFWQKLGITRAYVV